MTKTVDISGMDESRAQYGYEWSCQVLMFRALHWIRTHPEKNAKFHTYKNIAGVMLADNEAAKEMEKFALDHEKIREYGATGAMVQYSLIHAMQRNGLGEEAYFKNMEPSRIFEFDEAEAFPEGRP